MMTTVPGARAPGSTPDMDSLIAAARTGAGTPWLARLQAEELARHALSLGLGVRLMEASAHTLHEPPRDVGWEILGADPDGQNWDDHHNPARAFKLFEAKLAAARRAGARLQYKLWLGQP
ncbi:hypothetical protein GCM10011415_28960 [Salipiger pallidus]|uniref:Uncharacterized protein n=2 Tax=Salipiger pallidus TaxID=1775170 RepID=A0A8J3EHE8_9RHOB|nr:hypothetical protein GCM10011415_28960 [Salipiger pallidus]